MSAQIARNPTDLESSTAPSPLKSGHVKERNEGLTPWGESPDLLRWRADMLMDEMMLGAVDVYAGEPKVAAFSAVATAYPASTVNRSRDNSTPYNPEYHNPERPLPSSGTSETGSVMPRPLANSSNHEEPITGTPTSTPTVNPPLPRPPMVPPSAFNSYDTGRAEPVQKAVSNQPASTQPTSTPPNREPKAWVFSAEARYQQIARDQQAIDADSMPVNFTSSTPGSPPAPRWMPEEPTSLPINRAEPQSGVASHSTHGPELGPVRRTTQVAGAMVTPPQAGAVSVGPMSGGPNRNGKWSNLLPRMSTTDVQTLQQEITTLHSEINALLPSGHESNQRTQHLLEKAQTILASDPTRSAEVEYYLQQVRTIFQRVQQTIHWSNLYRNRLLVYLTGWSLLAMIVLIASYVYNLQMGGLIADLLQWSPDSFATQNFTTWLSTIAAGALGGAAGALLNLRLRSHLEHGFFDRKYGLRGLILPIMGMVFGVLLYVLVGPLFYLLELDPSMNTTVRVLPPLLSFAFGLGQEFIYGTRG